MRIKDGYEITFFDEKDIDYIRVCNMEYAIVSTAPMCKYGVDVALKNSDIHTLVLFDNEGDAKCAFNKVLSCIEKNETIDIEVLKKECGELYEVIR